MIKLTNEEKELIVGVAKNSNEAEVAIEIMTRYKEFIVNKLNEDKELLIKDIGNGLWTKAEEYATGMIAGINTDIEIIEGEDEDEEEIK